MHFENVTNNFLWPNIRKYFFNDVLGILQLNKMLKNVVSMIKAAANGDGEGLSLYFRDLLPSILRDLQSPLAAPYLSTLYLELSKCVFFTSGHKYLGKASHLCIIYLKLPLWCLMPCISVTLCGAHNTESEIWMMAI